MKYLDTMIVNPPEEVRQLPIGDYVPLAAAARFAVPFDLSKHGYTEEEYIISGYANVYAWPEKDKRPVIRTERAPYSTRILVRKPIDPARFSGFVSTESFNTSIKVDNSAAGWGMCHEHILASGDAWVGYTIGTNGMETLLKDNPTRYAGIGFPNPLPKDKRGPARWDIMLEYCQQHGAEFPLTLDPSFENGLQYDMSFQLVAAIKRCGQGDPFYGYNVKKVFGASICDYNTYISAFQPYMTIDGVHPVYDGYLMYMSAEGGGLNREEDMFRPEDERCTRYANVPVIKIQTSGDMLGKLPHPFWAYKWRCVDGDEPGRQMRWYELPGVPVNPHRRDKLTIPSPEDFAALGMPLKGDPISRYPYENHMGWMIMACAYRNIKQWMSDGTLPPKCDYLALEGTYPDTKISVDQYGNHLGGLRSTYVDVPIATFFEEGNIKIFDRGLRNRLYRNQEEYVTRVAEYAAKMVQDRWILPEAVGILIDQAKALEW